jgi:putative restriction endonuclease
MRYWWVNHKQTAKAELTGGYIWSPTKNKDDSANKSYDNLTYTIVGDVVFSYANSFIKAIGVVEKQYERSSVPKEFGAKGDQWHRDGYLVKIRWEQLDFPFKPKKHIDELKGLLPQKYSPIQPTGNGNQGIYLAEISEQLFNKILELINLDNDYTKAHVEQKIKDAEEDVEQEAIERSKLPATEKAQLIKARRGQGKFRVSVSKIETSCRVTKTYDLAFLTASHIKPWAESDKFEKLDGNNGLMLSPHIDRLFDQGWISFENNGDVLIAKDLPKSLFKLWGITVKNVGKFNLDQVVYLTYHREKLFRDNRK